ncbi:hypothetical protein GC177_04180 [bacterium]|nr:hypothetical protein [bacterium]
MPHYHTTSLMLQYYKLMLQMQHMGLQAAEVIFYRSNMMAESMQHPHEVPSARHMNEMQLMWTEKAQSFWEAYWQSASSLQQSQLKWMGQAFNGKTLHGEEWAEMTSHLMDAFSAGMKPIHRAAQLNASRLRKDF